MLKREEVKTKEKTDVTLQQIEDDHEEAAAATKVRALALALILTLALALALAAFWVLPSSPLTCPPPHLTSHHLTCPGLI